MIIKTTSKTPSANNRMIFMDLFKIHYQLNIVEKIITFCRYLFNSSRELNFSGRCGCAIKKQKWINFSISNKKVYLRGTSLNFPWIILIRIIINKIEVIFSAKVIMLQLSVIQTFFNYFLSTGKKCKKLKVCPL